jgi:hypothetical protein
MAPEEFKALFPFTVECKRRMTKDSFTLQADWMSDVGKRRILVFAAGKHPGMPMDKRLWCISACVPSQPAPGVAIGLPVLKMNRTKTIPTTLLQGPYSTAYIVYRKRYHLLEPLRRYLQIHGYIREQDVHTTGPATTTVTTDNAASD